MQTLSELRERAEETVSGKIHFQLLMWRFEKPSYGEWVRLVEDAILFEVGAMVQRRNDLHDLDEDALTAILVIALNSLNLNASGRVVNGNCDLSVGYDDYVWLAEAKIARNVTAIYGGYLQLTQRYQPGVANQNSGGLLLYCLDEPAKAVLAGWKAAVAVDVVNSNVRDDERSDLTFRSSDTNNSSGLEIEVMHFAFALKHDPQEDKKKLSPAALEAARSAKRAA
jgi:hypothetical protein